MRSEAVLKSTLWQYVMKTGTFSRNFFNLKWFTTAVQLSGNFSGMIELLAAVFFCFALLQPEVEYTKNYGKFLSKRCLLRSKKLVLFPP